MNQYQPKVFKSSNHTKRGFNYERYSYLLAGACAIAWALFIVNGYINTAPTANAATPNCVVVSELPTTGK